MTVRTGSTTGERIAGILAGLFFGYLMIRFALAASMWRPSPQSFLSLLIAWYSSMGTAALSWTGLVLLVNERNAARVVRTFGIVFASVVAAFACFFYSKSHVRDGPDPFEDLLAALILGAIVGAILAEGVQRVFSSKGIAQTQDLRQCPQCGRLNSVHSRICPRCEAHV